MKRLPLITSLVICVAALVTIVVAVRGCRKPAPKPGEPVAYRSVAEFNEALVRERMSDPEYTNGLAILADRQAKLARLRNEAVREFETWCKGFISSNAEARAVFDQIQALVGQGMSPTNAAVAELEAKLESLMAADPQGKYLLAKRDTIQEAIREHQGIAHDFIGARTLRQSQEHAGEEAALTMARRRQLEAEGKLRARPKTTPPATNRPPPRKEGWWTNSPPPAASSPGTKTTP